MEFKDVTVIKKANVFFNGGVASRTILFHDGTKKTLGIAQPGEFEFKTGAAEKMEILSGDLEVRIADGTWQAVKGGEAFDVPPDTVFVMKVRTVTDYCCSFLK